MAMKMAASQIMRVLLIFMCVFLLFEKNNRIAGPGGVAMRKRKAI